MIKKSDLLIKVYIIRTKDIALFLNNELKVGKF